MKPADYTEPKLENSTTETDQMPDAFYGDSSALEDSNSCDSLWSRYHPRDIPFFKVALMDQLLKRPYHSVILEGPFDIKQMVQDHCAHLFRSETSINRRGKSHTDRLLFCMGDGVFGYLDDYGFKIYAPTPEAVEAASNQFRRYVKPPDDGKPHFHILSITPEGPSTETVPIDRAAPVSTEELALNYGEDFPAWEQQWTERIQQTPSSLTILFGPPGCGKTTYLRALMSRLIDKAVFYYFTVSEAEMLSNPRFVSFWIRQTARYKGMRKVAILEDAEDLLLARDGASRDKVSNLLNIADGFLGDHLKLHIIATTNVPLSKLDPAIVRPGRLIGMREFRRLNREEALRLAKAKGLAVPDQRDFSLAELYCARTETEHLSQQQRIGFA